MKTAEGQAWARLAAIIQSSDDAIVGKTLEGIITSWNRGAEKIFGYTEEEAVGQSITLIIPADRLDEERDVLARIARGESVEHHETVRVRKDGTLIDISLTVSPIIDSNGEIIGASKIARDVTERKRVEAELSGLLLREQAARTQAESLNRAKDEFLGVLSHELRTPLNAIYGWARLLHDGEVRGASLERASEAILRNATVQLRLIEDLLDVSRIVTGNMRLDIRLIEPRGFIEAALDVVRTTAEAKGVRLESVISIGTVQLKGDAARLQQAIWNILSNALKFTPAGGSVQLSAHRKNSHLEIVIIDTGEGIPADLLPYIFDRFRQGDSSTTRRHGGLGVGLALVRHIVELHGGTVEARSPGEDRGATFIIMLPVASRERAPEATFEPGDAPPGPALVLQGVRVLLVDPDVDGLELMSAILGQAGAEVQRCVSPVGAIDVLRRWRPDVLLTELGAAEEDGYALLRNIRRDDLDLGRIKTAALTPSSRSEDRLRALSAGFNLHLSKPIDPTELIVTIRNLARRQS